MDVGSLIGSGILALFAIFCALKWKNTAADRDSNKRAWERTRALLAEEKAKVEDAIKTANGLHNRINALATTIRNSDANLDQLRSEKAELVRQRDEAIKTIAANSAAFQKIQRAFDERLAETRAELERKTRTQFKKKPNS